MHELDVPDESFSLIKKTEREPVQAFRGVGPERRKSIVELASQGVEFSEQDVNEMLQRRKRLREFEVLLVTKVKTNVGGRGSLTVTSGYSATA